MKTSAFDENARKPGVETTGERRSVSKAGTWWEAWQQFFF